MMAPEAFDRLVRYRQEQLWNEAANARLAAQVPPSTLGLRRRLARSLYDLATRLSAGVAEARGGADGIRSVATCSGVEYWRPSVLPLRR